MAFSTWRRTGDVAGLDTIAEGDHLAEAIQNQSQAKMSPADQTGSPERTRELTAAEREVTEGCFEKRTLYRTTRKLNDFDAAVGDWTSKRFDTVKSHGLNQKMLTLHYHSAKTARIFAVVLRNYHIALRSPPAIRISAKDAENIDLRWFKTQKSGNIVLRVGTKRTILF